MCQQIPLVSNQSKRLTLSHQPRPFQGTPTKTICKKYGERNLENCLLSTNAYFRCNKPNHMARDYPRKNTSAPASISGQRAIALARMFPLTLRDANASNNVGRHIYTFAIFSLCYHFVKSRFHKLLYITRFCTLGYDNTIKP